MPLEVWGPSGSREDMGTKYAVEHILKAYHWDYMTRAVAINPTPGKIKVHEFDYRGINQVVYEDKAKGVVIRSWPTIHAGDGPVSFLFDGGISKSLSAATPRPTSGLSNTPKTPTSPFMKPS